MGERCPICQSPPDRNHPMRWTCGSWKHGDECVVIVEQCRERGQILKVAMAEALRKASKRMLGLCHCHDGFKSRGLIDPQCECHDHADYLEQWADELQQQRPGLQTG